MNLTRFQTYGEGPDRAFETLCNQLFDRYLRRTYPSDLIKFRAINGAGGDGGIEAYGQLRNGETIVVQAKWFPTNIDDTQINQIRGSVTTAMRLRPSIKEYIICIPRNHNSTTFRRGPAGLGPRPSAHNEEQRIYDLSEELGLQFPGLTVTWWFEHDLDLQIQQPDNEGVHRFWFEREIMSFQRLQTQFDLQKTGWLSDRYIPELHGHGIIRKDVQQLLYDEPFRLRLSKTMETKLSPLFAASGLLMKFIPTISGQDPLHAALTGIQSWTAPWIFLAHKTRTAILSGQSNLNITTPPQQRMDDPVISALASINPSNVQKGYLQPLLDALYSLRDMNLQSAFAEIQDEAVQYGRLFIGDSGTGKTHGLTNTVETQLGFRAPAIIIRAKGTPCGDWADILVRALDTPGWNKVEMLSALETMAIRQDNRLAGPLAPFTDPVQGPTKVVICVDGLEEDTLHWSDWYVRMRETAALMEIYPRVRFVFSARTYYYDETKTPASPRFRVVSIPREGDVPVYRVIPQYFAPEHYNITVDPKLIRGLDTLFALRLFCNEYEGRTLTDADDIVTAEKFLLNKKVARMNQEFMELPGQAMGRSRKPVSDALETLTDAFYDRTDIEHDELFNLLSATLSGYLDSHQIDHLIDYLVNNGLLTRIEIPNNTAMLITVRQIYSLSYQSILTLVISDKLVRQIQSGDLTRIPEHLVTRPSFTQDTQAEYEKYETQKFINEKIVENTVKTLFYDHRKLIGENAFLTEGLSGQQNNDFQLMALVDAPKEIDPRYGQAISQHFLDDLKYRYSVFDLLLFPASGSSTNYFGAEFLHNILIRARTPFSRDGRWLGWDGYSIAAFERTTNEKFYRYDLQTVIDPQDSEFLLLPPTSLHDEYPLVYGWALSTLDQRFRHKLRVSLTGWALVQPIEFIALLNKLFPNNDPQIQEDLASITLGLAGKLTDKPAIEAIARWALANIFSDLERNRNVIVREGFRSIAERAFQFRLISEEEIKQARPVPSRTIQLLPLDSEALQIRDEELYPIVHDLAWYVIHRAYNDFFEYATEFGDEKKVSPDAALLRAYGQEGIADGLTPHSWAMAAAIAYMKSLGFDRTEGNGFTQASHGSKSKVFTLEEKYTWLAVHYLLGYLADNLPLKDEERYVNHYFEVAEIPNPAELLPVSDQEEMPAFQLKNRWVIQETLVPELGDVTDAEEAIRQTVQSEPAIDVRSWLQYNASDFTDSIPEQELLALYHYTTIHDSRQYIFSRIDARACLVRKGHAMAIVDLLQHHPSRCYFARDIDRMHSDPETAIYSNPSDIAWMNWIGEAHSFENYYPAGTSEEQLNFCLVSVTNNALGGEKEVKIPSRLARELVNIVSLDRNILFDSSGNPVALMHAVENDMHERQEILLVKKSEWLHAVDASDLEMIWFVELLHHKNELNKKIKSEKHPMKCRKYFVYYEGVEMRSLKFWDARFSNTPTPRQ